MIWEIPMADNKELSLLIEQCYQMIVCGHEGAANKSLTQLFELLMTMSPTLAPQQMQMLAKLLPIMFDAQQRRDMIYLADILKFELVKFVL